MLRTQQMKIILLNLVIVTLVMLAIVAAASVPQYTIAQKAGQGYTDGVNAARQTYMVGKNYNPACGFNHSDSYCLGYKTGYSLEWGKMILLH
jgi:cytochrome c5